MKYSPIFSLTLAVALSLLTTGHLWGAGIKGFTPINETGKCQVKSETGYVEITVGELYDFGRTVKTSRNSFLDIEFSEGNTFRLLPRTTLTITESAKNPKLKVLELTSGEVDLKLDNFPKDHKLQVETPTAICGAVGTTFKVSFESGQTSRTGEGSRSHRFSCAKGEINVASRFTVESSVVIGKTFKVDSMTAGSDMVASIEEGKNNAYTDVTVNRGRLRFSFGAGNDLAQFTVERNEGETDPPRFKVATEKRADGTTFIAIKMISGVANFNFFGGGSRSNTISSSRGSVIVPTGKREIAPKLQSSEEAAKFITSSEAETKAFTQLAVLKKSKKASKKQIADQAAKLDKAANATNKAKNLVLIGQAAASKAAADLAEQDAAAAAKKAEEEAAAAEKAEEDRIAVDKAAEAEQEAEERKAADDQKAAEAEAEAERLEAVEKAEADEKAAEAAANSEAEKVAAAEKAAKAKQEATKKADAQKAKAAARAAAAKADAAKKAAAAKADSAAKAKAAAHAAAKAKTTAAEKAEAAANAKIDAAISKGEQAKNILTGTGTGGAVSEAEKQDAEKAAAEAKKEAAAAEAAKKKAAADKAAAAAAEAKAAAAADKAKADAQAAAAAAAKAKADAAVAKAAQEAAAAQAEADRIAAEEAIAQAEADRIATEQAQKEADRIATEQAQAAAIAADTIAIACVVRNGVLVQEVNARRTTLESQGVEFTETACVDVPVDSTLAELVATAEAEAAIAQAAAGSAEEAAGSASTASDAATRAANAAETARMIAEAKAAEEAASGGTRSGRAVRQSAADAAAQATAARQAATEAQAAAATAEAAAAAAASATTAAEAAAAAITAANASITAAARAGTASTAAAAAASIATSARAAAETAAASARTAAAAIINGGGTELQKAAARTALAAATAAENNARAAEDAATTAQTNADNAKNEAIAAATDARESAAAASAIIPGGGGVFPLACVLRGDTWVQEENRTQVELNNDGVTFEPNACATTTDACVLVGATWSSVQNTFTNQFATNQANGSINDFDLEGLCVTFCHFENSTSTGVTLTLPPTKGGLLEAHNAHDFDLLGPCGSNVDPPASPKANE